MIHWEALNGMSVIEVGTRPNGKPHTILAINVLVVTSERDAKLVAKKCPGIKFVKKGRK